VQALQAAGNPSRGDRRRRKTVVCVATPNAYRPPPTITLTTSRCRFSCHAGLFDSGAPASKEDSPRSSEVEATLKRKDFFRARNLDSKIFDVTAARTDTRPAWDVKTLSRNSFARSASRHPRGDLRRPEGRSVLGAVQSAHHKKGVYSPGADTNLGRGPHVAIDGSARSNAQGGERSSTRDRLQPEQLRRAPWHHRVRAEPRGESSSDIPRSRAYVSDDSDPTQTVPPVHQAANRKNDDGSSGHPWRW